LISSGRETIADTAEISELSNVELGEPGSGRARNSIIWAQVVAFALGVGLLIYVIDRVGVQPIFDALARIGLGFFLLLAISGSRHVFRTVAMSISVSPEHRRFTFMQALAARLGGESISFLTFTGPLLGEATKIALLRRRVPVVSGVSALVIDNIIYNLSVVGFILTGALVMLAFYPLPLLVRYVLFAIAGIAATGIIVAVFASNRRVMLLSRAIDRMSRAGFAPHAITKRREHVYELESHVYDFYKQRTGAFFAIFGLDFLAHASSVLEVYFALRMLGYKPLVQASYVIESLTKVINFVFGFVPGTIGVYEGGTEVILRTLGFAAATGVALALVRKAAMLFWTSMGLIILAWRAVPGATRRVIERSPRLVKLMDSLVFSNIAHRPARTMVSIVGIGVGVLLIVFTVGLAHGLLRERGRREASIGAEIMIRASGTIGLSGSQPFTLPVSRAVEIQRIPGVRAAVPVGQSLDKSDTGFGSRIIDGIDFDGYSKLSGITLKEGRGLASGYEAIIDSVWQQQRNVALGSTVQIYDRPFEIVGVYEPPGGGRIKIPLGTMQDLVGGEGHCSMVLVACVNPAEAEVIAARVRAIFPEDQIIFTRDLPELYASGVPALNIFLNVVVGIAATISILVILLAMYTTVTERTRQIGILKSLGMSKGTIAWVIEQEALLVSFLGVAFGVALTLIFRFAVMRATSLTVEIEPKWVLIALGVGLIGGTMGALYPALRAANQDAVDALSYE
jgi:putative ABC transport system permease protein